MSGARFLLLAALVLLLAGCGGSDRPAYLAPHLPRHAVVAALDDGLCGHRMRVIENARPYWVGLCQDRSAFEDRVVFLAFDDTAARDFYLAHLESCFDRGHYLEGPQWFAMTVNERDAATVRRAGATTVTCPRHHRVGQVE